MRSIVFSLIVLGLGVGVPGWAAEGAGEAHDHHHAEVGIPTKPVLNHGKKWQTDAPLREAMENIKSALQKDLGAIHEGRLTKEQYSVLADGIQKNLDSIFQNCKLSPEADKQAHIVLLQMIDGVKAMKKGSDASSMRSGAVKVVQALDQYGKFFDHPGWKPLKH